mmetsp:Transcript_47484/g.111746  ORF Transcript_47484/g.111746 Transcript_47484/m.111746 type:complete len:144 (+) Transcript_47484:382-813(+)
MESVARECYERLTKQIVVEPQFALHKKHSWLGGTPDGFVGSHGLLEIKCPLYQLHTEVPLHYMCQVQGCLEIHDRAWCDFVSFKDGRMMIFLIRRSHEFWSWMQPRLQQFWAHVQIDEDPVDSLPVPPHPPPPPVSVTRLFPV